MNPKFWQERWQEGRIGFNQAAANPLLIKYFSSLDLPAGSRVFAPLSGKSVDMIWLLQQGYDVVGVELVESAVQDFFSEHNISPTITNYTDNSNIKCYQAKIADQKIELWVADIFALAIADIGQIDAVYDRAALIAMPADMRVEYSEQVRQLSGNAPQLLLTLNYDQSARNGPPFSISSAEVQAYYASHYQITELEGEPSTLNAKPEMAVKEYVWLLTSNREA